MRASLVRYRQSPRKTRLVADLVRGKSVPEALTLLAHLPKRAALPLRKLVASAAENARRAGVAPETLVIGKIAVDQGITFSRHMPRARGRATPIRKRTSRVTLELAPLPPRRGKVKKPVATRTSP